MPTPDPHARSAAEDRWCGEVAAHEGHEWSGSGQEYVCDGVPLGDSQEARSAATGRVTRLIERIVFQPDERVAKDELEAMWSEAEPVAVVSEWRHSSLCATTATGHLARCSCGADPRG